MQDFVKSQITFNTYDIFTNFIPGAVFLVGFAYPIYDLMTEPPSFGLVVSGVFLLSSFLFGIGLQTIGSIIIHPLGDSPFDQAISDMTEDEDEDKDIPDTDSQLEKEFYDEYKDLFEYDEHLSEGDQVFKTTVSYVESTRLNRSLRIQTLYLLTRGISVSLFCLVPYLFFGAINYDIILTDISNSNIWILMIFLLLIGLLFYFRARHFEEDVKSYLMSEFILAKKNRDHAA